MLKSQKDIVAIDIGSSTVKLVQLRESKGEYHLVNVGLEPLPPEAVVDGAFMDSSSVVEVVRSLVQKTKTKTKNVATAVSGHSVIIRNVNLPIMTEDELATSIQWEAEQYIPFEISDVNIDFHIIGPDSDEPSEMKVVIVAVKKEFVSDYMAIFKEASLKPVVLDVGCFAMGNAIELNYGLESDVVALVDIGANSINVNIVRDGISVFTRDIQTGGKLFIEEIQKRFSVGNEEALDILRGSDSAEDSGELKDLLDEVSDNIAQEVQRSIDFFSATASDDPVTRVMITGGVSQSERVCSEIRERLEIEVEVVDPFRAIKVDPNKFDGEYIASLSPYCAVAVGLAMRSLGDK